MSQRTGQNHSKRPKQRKISNMPDKEFKVMIIKILSELEKRVEDISETLKEMENISNQK